MLHYLGTLRRQPNTLQPLQDQQENADTNMATQWQHISEMWRGTCEEVLGRRKTQHKEWISADTLKKLHVDVRKEKKEALNNSRTRAAKAKALEDYTAIDKEF